MAGRYMGLITILCAQFVNHALFAQEDTNKDSVQIRTRTGWSQWRGPDRDGILRSENPWPERLSEQTFKQQWKIELGPSYSGPVVSSTLVFTTETRDEKTEVVTAFDRTTGKKVWETQWEGSLKVPFFANSNGSWIRATPAFDGENLYVAGMRDVLVCLDGTNGDVRWRVDFVNKFGTALPAFGFVCSPLLDGDFVYVQAGAGVCKLDKANGEIVWRTLTDEGGMNGSAFSSPVIATISGKRQLIVQARTKLAGISLDDGSVLWEQPIEAFRGMNILTPLVYNHFVFTSAYGGNSHLFNLSTSQDKFEISEAWSNKASAYMSSPIVIDGHIYMHLRNQRFTCIEIESGTTKWTTKPYGKYWSMIANGHQILALDERGELLLISANPDQFKLVDSQKISQSPTWGHIAFDNDQIFVRELNALVCYRWSATAAGK